VAYRKKSGEDETVFPSPINPLAAIYGGQVDDEGNPIPWREARDEYWRRYEETVDDQPPPYAKFEEKLCEGCYLNVPFASSMKRDGLVVDLHTCIGPVPKTAEGKLTALRVFELLTARLDPETRKQKCQEFLSLLP
jgi:hypothetical protein